MANADATIRIRRGTPADARDCNRLLYEAIQDFEARTGGERLGGTEAEWWSGLEPFYEMLAVGATEWWLAEDDGALQGFARSIESDGFVELTEFFVRPSAQGHGLGRELLARAFPATPDKTRFLIATRDVRALVRYYGAGLAIQLPMLEFSGATQATEPPAGLAVRRVGSPSDVDAIRSIERELLGFERRPAALATLVAAREPYLYLRDATPVGFAFVSPDGIGPIGALSPDDMPAILLHVEGRLHELGVDTMELELPAPNAAAARHLLARGHRIDPRMSYLMAERPFGAFDRFIGFNPPLFL
jgi:GNAT superfamily N-acetyltransferase